MVGDNDREGCWVLIPNHHKLVGERGVTFRLWLLEAERK